CHAARAHRVVRSFPTRRSSDLHSRDHRSDRPQALLAVATDAQGLPLHLEVLRGNRGDTTTQGLLSTLRRRFGIREAVFVDAETADRKSTRLNSSHDQISYAGFC